MIKTIKPPGKEGGKEKEDDKHSSQHSDAMAKTKHKFHPIKNSTKIVIHENEKPHVYLFYLIIISLLLKNQSASP